MTGHVFQVELIGEDSAYEFTRADLADIISEGLEHIPNLDRRVKTIHVDFADDTRPLMPPIATRPVAIRVNRIIREIRRGRPSRAGCFEEDE